LSISVEEGVSQYWPHSQKLKSCYESNQLLTCHDSHWFRFCLQVLLTTWSSTGALTLFLIIWQFIKDFKFFI